MSQWGQWSSPTTPVIVTFRPAPISPRRTNQYQHQTGWSLGNAVSQRTCYRQWPPGNIFGYSRGRFCGNGHNDWARHPNDDNVCVFFLLPSLIDMPSSASRQLEPPWQLCRPQIILDSFPSMLLLEFARLTFSHCQEFWAFGFSDFSSKGTKHALNFVYDDVSLTLDVAFDPHWLVCR